MKRLSFIAVAASLAINAGGLGVIASGIDASSLPRGQVTVQELTVQPEVVAYAPAAESAPAQRLLPL